MFNTIRKNLLKTVLPLNRQYKNITQKPSGEIIISLCDFTTNKKFEIWLDSRDETKQCFERTPSFNIFVPLGQNPTFSSEELQILKHIVSSLKKIDNGQFKISKPSEPQDISFFKEYEHDKSVVIYIKSRCDFRCCFCPTGAQGLSRRKLKEGNLLEKIIERYAYLYDNYTKFTLNGEEVLNHSAIIDIINFFTERVRELSVLTTGLKLSNSNFVKRIKNIEKITFTVPLYGADPGVHDELTEKKGSFSKILKTIKNHDLNIKTHTLILKKNLKHLNAIKDLCSHYKREHSFTIMHPVSPDDAHKKIYIDNAPMLTTVIEELTQILDKNEMIKFIEFNHWKIPLCLTGGHYSYKPLQAQSIGLNSKELKLGQESAFPTQCKHASYCYKSEECPGIFTQYIETYGWGEFSPIKS